MVIAQFDDTLEPIYVDHWHFDTPYYLFSTDEYLALSAGNHIGFFSTDAGDLELQELYALQKGHYLDDAPSGFLVDADTVWAGMTHAGISKYILSDSPLTRLDWSYEIFDDSFYDVRKSGTSIIYGKGLFVPKIISLSTAGSDPVFADTLFGNMSHKSWDVSGDLLAVTDVDSVYLYRVINDGIFAPELSLPLEHDSPGWRARIKDDLVVVMHVDGDLSFYELREGARQVLSLELRSVLDTRCNYGEVDVHENRVYVAGNGELLTIDMSDLSLPEIVQTVESDYLYEVDQLVYHDGDVYALRTWSLHPEQFLRIALSNPTPEVENLSPRWAGRVQALAQIGDNVIVFPDGDSVYVHDSDEPWRRAGYDLGLDSVRYAEANDGLIYTVSDRTLTLDLLSISGNGPSIYHQYEFPDDYPRIPYSFGYDNISVSEHDRLAVMLKSSSEILTRCGLFNIEDPLNIDPLTYLDYYGSTIALSEDANTLMSFPFYYSYGKGYAYDLTSATDSVSVDTLTILPEELRQVENRTVFGHAISLGNYWYITCTPSQGLNSGGYLCVLSQSASNEFIAENLIDIGPHVPTNLTITEDILIGSNNSIYLWDINDPINPELLLTIPPLGLGIHNIVDKNGYLHIGDGYSYVAYDVRAYLPERFFTAESNHVEMKIWPNPSDGSISFTIPNLQTKVLKVSVYNILGQLVNHSEVKNNGVNSLSFPAQIQSGIYIIEVDAHGQNVHGKVIIIR